MTDKKLATISSPTLRHMDAFFVAALFAGANPEEIDRLREWARDIDRALDKLAAANARAEAAEADRAALVDAIDRLLIAVYDLDGFKKCPEVIDHAEAVMRPHDLSGLVGELREKRGFNAPQEQGDE